MKIPSHLAGIASHCAGLRVSSAKDRKRPRDDDDIKEGPTSSSQGVAATDNSTTVVDNFVHDLRIAVASAISSSASSYWLLDLRKLSLSSRNDWKLLWDGIHGVFNSVSSRSQTTTVLHPATSRVHRLVALELEGSHFGDDGAASLAEAFNTHHSTFSSVTCWFLASARLSLSGLRLLLNAWNAVDNYGKSVRIIGLTNNPLIGGGGADQSIFAELSKALPSVQRLHANHVGLTTAGWKLWFPYLVASLPSLKNLWLKQNAELDSSEVLRDAASHPALVKAIVL